MHFLFEKWKKKKILIFNLNWWWAPPFGWCYFMIIAYGWHLAMGSFVGKKKYHSILILIESTFYSTTGTHFAAWIFIEGYNSRWIVLIQKKKQATNSSQSSHLLIERNDMRYANTIQMDSVPFARSLTHSLLTMMMANYLWPFFKLIHWVCIHAMHVHVFVFVAQTAFRCHFLIYDMASAMKTFHSLSLFIWIHGPANILMPLLKHSGYFVS